MGGHYAVLSVFHGCSAVCKRWPSGQALIHDWLFGSDGLKWKCSVSGLYSSAALCNENRDL